MDTNESRLLERCAAIAVSSWSDALDELGINGVLQASRNAVAAVECVALPSPPGNYRAVWAILKNPISLLVGW